MKPVYLDYSATTPMAPEVWDAMRPLFQETFGNPSSVHGYGRSARMKLEESRESIASFIGAAYDEVYFTSGGTESDNSALIGVVEAARNSARNHVIISAVEHHAVLHPAEELERRGIHVTILPVDASGLVDPADVRNAITPKTCLISIMLANNETGTLQPLEEIGAIGRERGVTVHTDAVQYLGKLPLDLSSLPVDLASFSAHKVYGPKGIGALFIRKGTNIEPLIRGGSQESNRRAGTESIPLAAGFAAALHLARASMERDRIKGEELKKYLETRLRSAFDHLVFNGHPERSLPTILSVSFDAKHEDIDGEALIMGMDLRGIAVTSGSACTSGSLQPSHVLTAMGRDLKTARATVRFSIGRPTTKEELDTAVVALKDVVKNMRPGGG